MKVDELSKEYRALVMLDWFSYVKGDRAILVCVKSYYDADRKEVKESLRGLYNRYWDILKNAFFIEPYQIDFAKYTKDDCSTLLENIANHLEYVISDQDVFCDKIENSPWKWEQFLREMSMTLVNIRANTFIAEKSPEFLQIHPESDLDVVISGLERNFDLIVKGFITNVSLFERLQSLISMLSALREAYYRNGGDIRTIINNNGYENEHPEIGPDQEGRLQKLFDDFKNIKEFEHYQSLFDELTDLMMTESTNSDPLKLLERYYAFLDEIYFDVYSLGTLVPSLIVNYNATEGGNKNESR